MTQAALTFEHHTKERVSGYETLTLTPEHAKEWTVTKAAFHYHCPAFTHLLSTMMNPRGDTGLAIFVEILPDGRVLYCAATDGVALLINPRVFFTLPLMQRVFVLAHEVLHNLFDHIGQAWRMKRRGYVLYPDGLRLPYDDERMNTAEDCVINAMLIKAEVGEFNPCWLSDPRVSHEITAVEAYRIQWEEPPPAPKGNGGGRSKSPDMPPRFDFHLPPGAGSPEKTNPDQVAANRNETEWKAQASAADAIGRQMGKMPAFLSRLFGEVVQPRVDWRDQVKGFFARRVGGGGYDWARPDRRFLSRPQMVIVPGRSGFGCGTIVVGADTSGSIGPRTLDLFMGEISGILDELRPRRLVILWCDASVHDVDECEDAGDLNHIRRRGVKGGGGTSFVPVFDWVLTQDLTPDALIYLTDMAGHFPSHPPSYPVLWASIEGTEAPFGDVVMIPRQKED